MGFISTDRPLTEESGMQLRGSRLLTAAECEQVSGGTEIVVTGSRPTFTPDYAGYFFMMSGGSGGFRQGYEMYEPAEDYEPVPVTDSDPDEGMFNEVTETAIAEGLEGLTAVLKAMMEKYGGDFDVKMPNGIIYKASSLVAGSTILGAALAAHEGYGHYQDLMNGDPNVAAIVGFVGGLAVGAGAAALGVGPLAAFVAGMGVKYGVEYGFPAIANLIADAGEQAGIFLDETSDAIFDGTYDPNAPSSIQIWQALTNIFNPGAPQPPEDPSYPGDPDGHRYPPGVHPW